MKALIFAAIGVGLYALVLAVIELTGALDGIAYTLPNAPRRGR